MAGTVSFNTSQDRQSWARKIGLNSSTS
jgi:hypothetical protein